MNHAPQPSTYGQTIDFQRTLFAELMQFGYSHPDILSMSLSKALLARYGSVPAIDLALGHGTAWGVRQPEGGLNQWRKPWARVREEQLAIYLDQLAAQEDALDALSESLEVAIIRIEECREARVAETEIRRRLQKLQSPKEWCQAS